MLAKMKFEDGESMTPTKPSLTEARRAELRKLCDEATPGPWMHDEEFYPAEGMLFQWDGDGPDAAFIAASRTAIPELLDALDAAERERDTLATALEWYADMENWRYPYSDDMEPGDTCERGALVDMGGRARVALREIGR